MTHHDTLKGLRWLRHASLLEGATLLILLGAAVPVKYLAGYPLAVQIVGPVHGAVFLTFLGLLAASQRSIAWRRAELYRLVIGAFLPFGALLNAELLNQRELALTDRVAEVAAAGSSTN